MTHQHYIALLCVVAPPVSYGILWLVLKFSKMETEHSEYMKLVRSKKAEELAKDLTDAMRPFRNSKEVDEKKVLALYDKLAQIKSFYFAQPNCTKMALSWKLTDCPSDMKLKVGNGYYGCRISRIDETNVYFEYP